MQSHFNEELMGLQIRTFCCDVDVVHFLLTIKLHVFYIIHNTVFSLTWLTKMK